MSNELGMTLDEIKVHYADALLESHVLRRELVRVQRELSDAKRTISLLVEKKPRK